MKKLLLLLNLFFYSIIICAQAPSIQWQKSLGGFGSESASCIENTSDGGFIVVGRADSNSVDVTGNHGKRDCWIVKLNNIGTIQWSKSIGGSNQDVGTSIKQTTDGGYIIAGYTNSNDGDVSGNHGNYDYWIIKLNSIGNIAWQKSLGGSSDEFAYSTNQTVDGGYIIAGYTSSNDFDVSGNHGQKDFWIVKLDSSGSIVWQKSLGGTNNDIAYSVVQTPDMGYVITGSSESSDGDLTVNYGAKDCWVVKIDNLGIIQWQESIGYTLVDEGRDIKNTSDGCHIIAIRSTAISTVNPHSYNFWIVKINNTGVIQWQKIAGGTLLDECYSIEQTVDGGYILAGISESNDGDANGNHGKKDYWVLKLDGIGTIQWQKSLGGTDDDIAYSIKQSNDGGYIIAGNALSTNGNITNSYGNQDYWIVKLNTSTSVLDILTKNSVHIFPNPSTGQFTFSNIEKESVIEIYDITGRLIFNTTTQNISETIDLSKKGKGVYFYKIISDKKEIQQGKLIIQ